MSIHPSLNIAAKDKKQRSVLKRIERLKMMIDKKQWKDEDDIFGLPKIKTIKIKIKKEKVEKAEGTAAGATAAPAKDQAAAKAPAGKGPEKK
ncbi:small basic protein [bacterium]|nr:MAG: small basic protein [bacterium]